MLRFLLRQGFRRGVLQGSRPWLVVGGAALGLRVLRTLSGGRPETVYSEKLAPGETLVIAHERDATIKG
jgi:hypothetical protein